MRKEKRKETTLHLNQLILSSDINETLFSECLFTSDAPDLVVRTSGERRLSDFLVRGFFFLRELLLSLTVFHHTAMAECIFVLLFLECLLAGLFIVGSLAGAELATHFEISYKTKDNTTLSKEPRDSTTTTSTSSKQCIELDSKCCGIPSETP